MEILNLAAKELFGQTLEIQFVIPPGIQFRDDRIWDSTARTVIKTPSNKWCLEFNILRETTFGDRKETLIRTKKYSAFAFVNGILKIVKFSKSIFEYVNSQIEKIIFGDSILNLHVFDTAEFANYKFNTKKAEKILLSSEDIQTMLNSREALLTSWK